MAAIVGVEPPGGSTVWGLDVAISFEGAEPNTTAEFRASFDLVGTPSVHSASEGTVDDFMAMLATALGNVAGRTCYVTLNKLTVASDQTYSNAS